MLNSITFSPLQKVFMPNANFIVKIKCLWLKITSIYNHKTIYYTLHENGRGELPDQPSEQSRTTPPQTKYSPLRTKRKKEERETK